MHLFGSGFEQDVAAFIDGGSRGHHIVDQDDVFAVDAVTLLRRDGEGAAHIVLAFFAFAVALAGRGAGAAQAVGKHKFACQRADLLRQQTGLVIAALEQPPAMQGHGDQGIGFVKTVLSRPLHPDRQGGRGMRAVAMLKS